MADDKDPMDQTPDSGKNDPPREIPETQEDPALTSDVNMGDANEESGNGNADGAVPESKPVSDTNDNDPNAKLADAGAEGARFGDAMEVDANQEHPNLAALPEADWKIVPNDYKSQDPVEPAGPSKAIAEQEDHPMADPQPDVQPGAPQASSEPTDQGQQDPTADEIREWSKKHQTDLGTPDESYSMFRENVLARLRTKNAAGYKMQQQDDEEAEVQGPSGSTRSRKHTSQFKSTDDDDGLFIPYTRGSPDNVDGAIAGGALNEDNSSGSDSSVKAKAKPKRNKGAPKGAKSGKITKTAAKETRRKHNLLNFNLKSSAFSKNEDESEEDNIAPCEATNVREALRWLGKSVSAETASSDIPQLRRAINIFGSKRCDPTTDGKWKIPGIRSPLEHFQVVGVGEMRKLEIEANKAIKKNVQSVPRGGLLADEMGLGKTPMILTMITIARMHGRTAKQAAEKRLEKATLIVCPVALKKQWEEEIEKHVEEPHRGLITEYKASVALKYNLSDAWFESASYVVTTYNEVQNSYPKPPKKFKTEAEEKEWLNSEDFTSRRGQLHGLNWERVVFDEAHAIKNQDSRTSQACIALVAKFYWAVSGTPSLNSPNEFYPYFKLVRFPGISAYDEFAHRYINSKAPERSNELLAGLAKFMIRRTHVGKFLGKTNLSLPSAVRVPVFLTCTKLEREIYQVVNRRFIAKVNETARSNSPDSQYNCLFTLVLRLRQLTAHILLIHDSITDLLEPEDIIQLREIIKSNQTDDANKNPILAPLRDMLYDTSNKRLLDPITEGIPESATSGTIGDESVENTEPVTFQKGFGMGKSAGSYLLGVEKEQSLKKTRESPACAACGKSTDNFAYLDCGCMYCLEPCISRLNEQKRSQNRNSNWCMICGDSKGTREKDPDSRAFRETIGLKGTSAGVQRCAKMINRWVDDKGDLVTSTKMVAIRDQIRSWIKREPSTKIIVYSQFIPMLLILAKMCRIESWNIRIYNGQMSQTSRDKVLGEFKDPKKKVQILLMSLKAGGVGLNLPEASKVIIVDPWWNSGLDDQAFYRVYRRGQKQETSLVKFIIRGTIDAHIFALQKKKERELNGVYAGAQKLTALELMSLLGKVETDENGKPYIVEMNDKDIENCINEESDDEMAN